MPVHSCQCLYMLVLCNTSMASNLIGSWKGWVVISTSTFLEFEKPGIIYRPSPAQACGNHHSGISVWPWYRSQERWAIWGFFKSIARLVDSLKGLAPWSNKLRVHFSTVNQIVWVPSTFNTYWVGLYITVSSGTPKTGEQIITWKSHKKPF